MSTYNDDFFNVSSTDPYYYEGPSKNVVNRASVINSSSIDTSTFDNYRQGIEITRFKHFGNGTVKIHSGEPHHAVTIEVVKYNTTLNSDQFFDDTFVDFDPEMYIENTVTTAQFNVNDTISLDPRIPWSDALEPFTIRSSIVGSTYVNNEPRSFKGSLMDGNIDMFGASGKVLSTYSLYDNDRNGYFLDYGDDLGSIHYISYVNEDRTTINPFVDNTLYARGMRTNSTYTSDILSALASMTGSWDPGYVDDTTYVSACGWDHSTTSLVKTDSIAFGGQTY